MGEVFPKRSGKAGSKKREGDNPMSRTSKIFLRQSMGQSRPLHHHPCSPASGLREGKDGLAQSHFSSLRENGRYQKPHPSFSTITAFTWSSALTPHLHQSRTSRTKRFGWFFFLSRSRQNKWYADMLRTESSQQKKSRRSLSWDLRDIYLSGL